MEGAEHVALHRALTLVFCSRMTSPAHGAIDDPLRTQVAHQVEDRVALPEVDGMEMDASPQLLQSPQIAVRANANMHLIPTLHQLVCQIRTHEAPAAWPAQLVTCQQKLKQSTLSLTRLRLL